MSATPRGRRVVTALLAAALVAALGALTGAVAVTSNAAEPWGPGEREPQQVEPRVTLYAISAAPGRGPSVRGATRLAAAVSAWISENGTDLAAVSATGSNDLPVSAGRAYREAARRAAAESPGCRLPWTLLAAVGRVESDHGRYGGSVLGLDGRPRPAIVGVALDGVGPVRAVTDTDDGRWDGDRVWDRAVGPMQFIPGTWATSGRDGDGNGLADPQDLDDAALAAASYLCRAGDLGDPATRSAAILSYNRSTFYVDLVNAYEAGYRTGVFAIPSPTAPR